MQAVDVCEGTVTWSVEVQAAAGKIVDDNVVELHFIRQADAAANETVGSGGLIRGWKWQSKLVTRRWLAATVRSTAVAQQVEVVSFHKEKLSRLVIVQSADVTQVMRWRVGNSFLMDQEALRLAGRKAVGEDGGSSKYTQFAIACDSNDLWTNF